MALKLNLLERYKMLRLLPAEGNYLTIGIVRKAIEVLSPSPEEGKEFELRFEKDLTFWNEKGNQPKEIPIDDAAVKLVEQKLVELEKGGKLEVDQFSLYEKIFLKKE